MEKLCCCQSCCSIFEFLFMFPRDSDLNRCQMAANIKSAGFSLNNCIISDDDDDEIIMLLSATGASGNDAQCSKDGKIVHTDKSVCAGVVA